MKCLIIVGGLKLLQVVYSYFVFRLVKPDLVLVNDSRSVGGKVKKYYVGEWADSRDSSKEIEDLIYNFYKNSDELEKVIFIYQNIRCVAMNLVSEYSYLKLLYSLHRQEAKNDKEFLFRMFDELDKLWRYYELIYEEKVKFERDGKFENVCGKLIAYYEGERNELMYRYLFSFADFVVYKNDNKKEAGIIVNKRNNMDWMLREFAERWRKLVKGLSNLNLMLEYDKFSEAVEEFKKIICKYDGNRKGG